MFNNCKQALDCDTWRHDSILLRITQHLKPNSFRIYVDSVHLGFPSPKGLFSGKIHDIILQQGDKLIVIELTCPSEMNLLSSCEYKADCHKGLKSLSLVPCNDLELILLEISALGFVIKHVKDFKNLFHLFKCYTNKSMMCCSEVVIRCLYYIYYRRSKE